METEEQEWIQQTLVNYERNQCISKFCSLDQEEAAPSGNNYNSDIVRIKMKVVLNSGELEERSVIFKSTPKSEFRRKALKYMGITVTEARMFTEVLPKIEKYRLSKEKSGEPLVPICYGIRNLNEDFLLEDLQAKGFELSNRHEGIDFDHVVFAVKVLAKFHAIGAVLIESGEIILRDFNTNAMKKEREKMELFFTTNFEELAETIEKSWDPEWQSYVEKIKTFSKSAMDLIINASEKDDKMFKTINHGDFWISNMLFRHDSDGKPNGLRMIDFQQSYYTSPIMDLQYFLSTSPREDVLDRKREIFLIYCDHLQQYLKLYEYSGKIPEHEELEEIYRLCGGYALTIGLVVRPLMMMPSDHAADLEKFSKNWSENIATKISAYTIANENCLRILKKNLKEGLDLGLL